MSGVWFEHPTNADIPAAAVGFQTRPDAWHAFTFIDWFLLATAICSVSAAIACAADRREQVSLEPAAAVAALGAVSAVLIGYRIIDPVHIAGVEYRRDLAIFLAFGAAVLVSLGGLWALRDRGTDLARELNRPAGRSTAAPRVKRGSAQPYGVGRSARRSARRLSPRKR